MICSGQVYVDLVQKRQELKLEDKVAIIRLEQIGPFPYLDFEEVIKEYPNNAKVLYVQEEHYNFGPFVYVQPRANLVLEE